MHWIGALLAISLLIIIHEFGHYIVARAFGMRVLTFSIGFGPALVRWRPKGSETVFQIALIPVLAYVQIAGMNPRDQTDPDDRGSYQNAKPIARFLTIAAGPLANFIAAGGLIFLMVLIGGTPTTPSNALVGSVMPTSAAAAAGLRPRDVVRQVNGRAVRNWDEMRRAVSESQQRPVNVGLDSRGMVREINGTPVPGWDQLLETMSRETSLRPVALVVERDGRMVNITVTPRMDFESGSPVMGVTRASVYRSATVSEAFEALIVRPTEITAAIVRSIPEMFHRSENVQLMGPVGIVRATAEKAEESWRDGLFMVAMISLQLFIFNLLPIPALDGGRLVVLGYEMTTRRRPNPKFEARVLTFSILLMLGVFVIVTSRELWGEFMRLLSRIRG
jgi:regulator of sigma E protease